MFQLSQRRFLAAALSCSMIVSATSALAEDTDTIVATWFSDWGDAKYAGTIEHLDYVNPDAPKGGEISMGTVGTFDSMNPFATTSGTPAALSSTMYERLMISTADEYTQPSYCLLCETIEYPESQDWVIFNLRKDVTFSDGSPMTAEDVVFSHNKFIAEGTPSWRVGVSAMIKNAEALDPYTVKYTFQPGIPRKGLIEQAGATLVFQKKWFEETGARLDEKRNETSPGTGAYTLAGFKAGEWVEYTRNPEYWGASHPFKVGRENYDTIRVEYFGDTIAAFEAFKTGDITFRQENSSLQWATGYDFPALEQGWVTKASLPNGTMPPAYGILFNLRREKLQDRNVRRALGLMFNFTWTNDTLQYGLFSQRESFWNAGELAATGVATGKELAYLESVKDLIPAEILTEPVTLAHTSGNRSLDRKNLRKALGLMEEAGYIPGDDGKLRNAAGETLDIEFLQYSPNFDRIIVPYVENLQALGVNAVYNRVDANQYQARTQSFDYDVIYDGYVNSFEEDSSFDQKFGSRGVDDIFNPAGYSSPAIDVLGEEILKTHTYDDMAAVVRAADRIMRYDYFVVPAWFGAEYWVAHYDMYEHPPTDQFPPLALGYLDFWWYNADKAADLKAAGAIK
ncbi:extracellular solute-binding protein [Pacificibacter marinus]|uniref:Periplasmic oligopeptide-binding protein n=1 Tax=Pacificibacter marinus TaxID=658057 RepID=A0A1Y5S8W1_9RHOB|nr:extracellular solute-binding protein [Pacificibacter marinus]SEK77640.1 microcin C transport system substrate-binding protein [Pacificibacter marinus]SLN34047.1 Periplasmic oligopeptide-binding protein precursor [Pacificibacter marinus]